MIKSPQKALWVMDEKNTPNSAENSMIPSSAIFVIPDFAATPAASVAKRMGVAVLKMVAKKSGDKIALHILCHLLFF